MNRIVAPPKPCGSCPFRIDNTTSCFDPKVLDKTVGANLRSRTSLHCCHSADTSGLPLCMGNLIFLKQSGQLHDFVNWRILVQLGLFTEEQIDTTTAVPKTWREVLQMHRRRLPFSTKSST